jgi:hypothetical protein
MRVAFIALGHMGCGMAAVLTVLSNQRAVQYAALGAGRGIGKLARRDAGMLELAA